MDEPNDSKFATRKWNLDNDNSKVNYGVGDEINWNRGILKFNLCNYKDSYFLVRGDITATAVSKTKEALKIMQYLLSVSQKLIEKQ